MSELPSTPGAPVPYAGGGLTPQDQSNLDLLGIFYFIFAAIYALLGFIPGIYIILGLLFGAAGLAGAHDAGDAGVAAGFGGLMVCGGLFLMGLSWFMAYLYFLAGKGLRTRRRLMLCYIMAVLVCFFIPLGTILGVFTFVTLSKPGVKAAFV